MSEILEFVGTICAYGIVLMLSYGVGCLIRLINTADEYLKQQTHDVSPSDT